MLRTSLTTAELQAGTRLLGAAVTLNDPIVSEILDIHGLDGVVIGPADLSASVGHIGEIDHPEVQRRIDTIIRKTRDKGRILGVGGGGDVATAQRWIARGAQWLQLGGDAGYLLSYARQLVVAIRSDG